MNAKKVFLNALVTVVISYILAFTIVGILWDPNGVILFERPFTNAVMIVFSGLFMALYLGLTSFFSSHPIPITMGLGFLACFAVAMTDIKEETGKRLLYVLVSFLTVLGTVQFCLMA